MKNIELDWYGKFHLAWNRDDPYHGMDDDTYFDKVDIDIINIPKDKDVISEEERKEMIQKVENNPDRYHLIKPLSHFKHHEIFNEYLEKIDENIVEVCNTKSIGGFKEDLFNKFSDEIFDEVWYGWSEFHNESLKKIAKEWLKKFGYNVTWA